MIVGDGRGAPTVGAVAYEGMTLRDEPEYALAGDGTVPHSCSVLPGARAFLAVGAEHSMLCASRGVIEAVADVLAGRPVLLPEFSDDPAAHLATVSPARPAPAPLSVHGQRAPELDPIVDPATGMARSLAPAVGGLNGSFLTSYDGREAQPEQPSAVVVQRREQLREGRKRQELQAASAGRDARLPSFELILDASNLLPFDFLRTGDRLGRAI